MSNAALYHRRLVGSAHPNARPLQELEQHVKARGWTIAATYQDRDDEWSAAQALIADARSGRFDVVVGRRVSELFRTTHELLHVLSDLARRGVGYAFVDDELAADTASVIVRLAEIDVQLRENELEAMQRVSRPRLPRGRGRPRKEFPVAKAQRLHAAGWSLDDIGNHLGVSKATVSRALGSFQKSGEIGVAN
jgi:DNA invertase Pin-like site-specific DNA recombinase